MRISNPRPSHIQNRVRKGLVDIFNLPKQGVTDLNLAIKGRCDRGIGKEGSDHD